MDLLKGLSGAINGENGQFHGFLSMPETPKFGHFRLIFGPKSLKMPVKYVKCPAMPRVPPGRYIAETLPQ